MLRRDLPAPPAPARPRRLRILIEDPQLLQADLPPPGPALDLTVCGGPCGDEVCPLVLDGACPLGPCDAVVTALDGVWARSVQAAWERTATPVVDARELATTDAVERLTHHVGAALQRLWEPFTSEWQPGDR